jgi:hypothetical protein
MKAEKQLIEALQEMGADNAVLRIIVQFLLLREMELSGNSSYVQELQTVVLQSIALTRSAEGAHLDPARSRGVELELERANLFFQQLLERAPRPSGSN